MEMIIVKDLTEYTGSFDDYCDFLSREFKNEVAYLNQLDLLPFLKHGIEISDLMAEIHDAYNDEYEGDDMFDSLDEEALMEYLSNRFNVEFNCNIFTRFSLGTDIQKGTRYDQNVVSGIQDVE